MRLQRDLPVVSIVARSLLIGAVVLFAAPTHAAPEPPRKKGDGLPVIAAGREADILKLIEPYKLGSVVAPGWQLDTVPISETTIRYVLVGPEHKFAALRLELPERSPSPERTPSFAVHRELPTGVAPSLLDPLVAVVKQHDDGKFWPAAPPSDPVGDDVGSAGTNAGASAQGSSQQPSKLAALLHSKAGRAGLLGGALVLVLAWLLLERRRSARSG